MRQTQLAPHEIRNLRRTLGMTQEQFGELFDCTAPTVYRWENGIYEPDTPDAAALVRLWNEVERRQKEADPSVDLESFAKGLLAGGIFGLLIAQGSMGSESEEK